MIPAHFFRQNLALIKAQAEKRGAKIDFGLYEDLEAKRKSLQVETEALQAQSNQLSKSVPVLKREGKDASEVLAQLSEIAKQKKAHEGELRELKESLNDFLLQVPNLLDDSVPEGSNEDDNLEVGLVGSPPSFAFSPKSHLELMPKGLDVEAAVNMSGSRFVVLKGACARLNRALGQWMLDTQVSKGYTEVNPPLLVEKKALYGTGQLPKFAEDQFFTKDETHALIPTAEVPLTNLVREQIIEADQLPIKLTALTPCFRSEAGAYGKDTTGLIRLHQFEKVELVQITTEAQAKEAFEQLVADAEFILKSLGLAYRKVLLCAGDTGFGSNMTYDLEVWLPSENKYREISSCSYFRDFQAQRMMARYRTEDRQIEYLHTINGSGLAVGRTLIAVLENYQTEQGTVIVPEVLRPYMGGLTEISD